MTNFMFKGVSRIYTALHDSSFLLLIMPKTFDKELISTFSTLRNIFFLLGLLTEVYCAALS